MRSTPQVAGTLRDSLKYARAQVETELNGVGDNPIFLTNEKEVMTGANFQRNTCCITYGNGWYWIKYGCSVI